MSINTSEGNISNKVKIKIRKDLLNYNLSLKYISEQNRVSIYTVESELLGINESIPKYVINLPRVISFDEFKADTNEENIRSFMNYIDVLNSHFPSIKGKILLNKIFSSF